MEKKNSTYQQKSGFKVPQNYFEDFEARIMYRVVKEAGLHDAYKANPGFKVSPGYFESFEDKLFEKLDNRSKKGTVISLFNISKYYYAAAIAAIFIGFIFTFFNNPVTTDFDLNSLELTTIENYIDEGFIDLNFNEISAFITEEGYSYESIYTTGLSNDEVFDYINENIEDHELLLYE